MEGAPAQPVSGSLRHGKQAWSQLVGMISAGLGA